LFNAPFAIDNKSSGCICKTACVLILLYLTEPSIITIDKLDIIPLIYTVAVYDVAFFNSLILKAIDEILHLIGDTMVFLKFLNIFFKFF